MSLNLTARSFRHAAHLQKPEVIDAQFVLFGHRLAHRVDNLIPVQVSTSAVEFRGDYQSLPAAEIDRKGGATSRPESGVAFLYGQFYVLRIMISPVNDDEILKPAGDEELSFQNKPQVSGP
jgi:hypothetical protein